MSSRGLQHVVADGANDAAKVTKPDSAVAIEYGLVMWRQHLLGARAGMRASSTLRLTLTQSVSSDTDADRFDVCGASDPAAL